MTSKYLNKRPRILPFNHCKKNGKIHIALTVFLEFCSQSNMVKMNRNQREWPKRKSYLQVGSTDHVRALS